MTMHAEKTSGLVPSPRYAGERDRVRGNSASTVFIVLTILFSPAVAVSAEVPAPQAMATTDGVKFGVWPALPKQPAPTLFILSASWQDALGTETFRKAGTQLAAEHGYLCVSVDLP